MTPIQIITIKTKAKTVRIMIEEISKNKFRTYESLKNNGDKIFSPFTKTNDEFTSAERALLKSISTFNNNLIIEVDNQISDLLTTNKIKDITKVTTIKEI